MSLVNNAVRLKFETLRSLGFASITTSYAAVGAALAHPASQIVINNLTDEDLLFSFDGTNDHIAIGSRGTYTCDITTNRGQQGLWLQKGTILYVKELGNPAAGSVYFSVLYASDGL